jgi:hypothetical protein
MSSNKGLPQGEYRRPWGVVALIFFGLIVASGIVYGIHRITSSDDDGGAAATETTQGNTVSASDEDITELPQNPSLRLFEEEGTTYVENDGNVTMSEVAVRDAAGATVCDMGTLSPADRQACDVADALRPIVAVGSGPQGQAVETRLE